MNANVLIGHGISNDLAISNMLKLSSKLVKAKLVEKITDAFQI